MRSDIKKEKYPDGGLVYVVDYSNEFGPMYRIGMTSNMTARKRLYKTHLAHNHKVVLIKETNCPIKLETCVRALLYDHRYQDGRDFYECSLNTIKSAFNNCSKVIDKCGTDQSGGSITYKTYLDDIITKCKHKKLSLNYQIQELNDILY